MDTTSSSAQGWLAGHLWTIVPSLKEQFFESSESHAGPFTVDVEDRTLGRVRLTGRLDDPGSESLVVILHGHGGHASKPYCRAAAGAARRSGMASLRLSFRGADQSGEDIYHAGLCEDVEAVLDAPQVRQYRRIFVLGYSMGGHMALRFALRNRDARVQAVAAICPPLDLSKAVRAFDEPGCWFYRQHVLGGLNRMYRAVEKRRRCPTPASVVALAHTCAEWDSLTVVPRFGFSSVSDYYDRVNVAPRLARVNLPALVVVSTDDPMIPMWTMTEALAERSPAITVKMVPGAGHISFPPLLNLGFGGSLGLEPQVMSWFRRHAGLPARSSSAA